MMPALPLEYLNQKGEWKIFITDTSFWETISIPLWNRLKRGEEVKDGMVALRMKP